MYGCKSWTIKKAECQIINAFEMWSWRRLFESPLDCKEIQPVHPKGKSVLGVHRKDQCWSWNSNILVTWCREMTYLKRSWCWERLKAGGEGDGRGWDGWMASPTRGTWASFGSWWWTEKPGMLQSMGSQRVGHDGATELTWPQHNKRPYMTNSQQTLSSVVKNWRHFL